MIGRSGAMGESVVVVVVVVIGGSGMMGGWHGISVEHVEGSVAVGAASEIVVAWAGARDGDGGVTAGARDGDRGVTAGARDVDGGVTARAREDDRVVDVGDDVCSDL